MHKLVLLLILVVTTFDPLSQEGWLPQRAPQLFEVLAAFCLLYVVVAGVRNQFRDVRPEYWFVLGTIAISIVCGVFVNALEPGPMFTGVRNYIRVAPLFLLPAVCNFTDRQIRTQLHLLIAIGLIQTPVALSQRLAVRARGGFTGDTTVGTLVQSSFLSIYLIGGICILTAFLLRKQIKGRTYALLFVLLIFPTTINETKATFVLLPLALLVVFFVLAPPGKRLKNVLLAGLIVGMFAALFIPIYDYLIQDRPYPVKLTDFFTREDMLEQYLSKDSQMGVQEHDEAGRIDSILISAAALSKDPAQFMFGLGIGNVSDSPLGVQFVGRYHDLFKFFLTSTVPRLLLELGVLGLGLVFLLYWMIYKDTRFIASHSDGIKGSIAAGWTGFMIVIVMCNFYKDLFFSDAISALFWYFSGLIAAERTRMLRETSIQAVSARRIESRVLPRAKAISRYAAERDRNS